MTKVPSGPRTVRRRLGRYAFWLACVIALLVSFVLINVDRPASAGPFLSAIGVNLLAAIVFALIFSALSDRVQQENLRLELAEQFKTLKEDMRADLQRTASTYLPTTTYRAASTFEDAFNRDITSALATTTFYGFRGTSAKYVAQRVKLARHRPLQVRVITLDPTDEPSLRRRATDRLAQPGYSGRSTDELVREIRDEIFMSVVALFDIREVCPVELLLVSEPLVTRVELFDDSVFVSWYQGPDSTAVPFPETLRFQSQSFPYEIERLSLARRFDLGGAKVRRFGAADNDAVIRDYLGELQRTSVTVQELGRWREEYQRFIAPFERKLRAL